MPEPIDQPRRSAVTPALILRAVRLPFVTASLLPFVFGSLLATSLCVGPFLLGLIAVLCTHLAANLANDWADSASGVDARDPTYYGFFGGSKGIVQGRLTAGFYRNLSIALAAVAAACVLSLALAFDRRPALGFYAAILLLAAGYSLRPLRLAYRRLGEGIVFLLFGPATVVGAAYIQTGALSTAALWASLPFGFLTAAILVANEVPDAADDAAAGKRTLVGLIGPRRGYVLYLALVGAAYVSIVAEVSAGLASAWMLWLPATAPLAGMAAILLARHHADKRRLLVSSRLTILLHAVVATGLIVGTRL